MTFDFLGKDESNGQLEPMDDERHGASGIQVDNPLKTEAIARHQLPLQPSLCNEGEWFSRKMGEYNRAPEGPRMATDSLSRNDRLTLSSATCVNDCVTYLL